MQRFTRRFLAACVFSGLIASTGALAEVHPTIRAMSGVQPINQLNRPGFRRHLFALN